MKPASGAQSVEVKVPGKIMLAGEYSVLNGGRSLSAAVDAYLSLSIAESSREGVWVESSLWPEPRQVTEGAQAEPLIDSLLPFVPKDIPLRVEVQSDLDVAYGLGSSSAVRLAAHLATRAFQKQSVELSSDELWDATREAWQRQRASQGFASGYDFVTQLKGGLVSWLPDYEQWPGSVETFSPSQLSELVHPYVGGKGAPTGSVGSSVKEFLTQKDLWSELGEKSEVLIQAFLAHSSEGIIQAAGAQQALFLDAPFYPQTVRNLLASLSHFGRSWSFKTTGAGGEDAILLLGPRSELQEADQALRREGWRPLPHTFTRQGSRIAWKDLGP